MKYVEIFNLETAYKRGTYIVPVIVVDIIISSLNPCVGKIQGAV